MAIIQGLWHSRRPSAFVTNYARPSIYTDCPCSMVGAAHPHDDNDWRLEVSLENSERTAFKKVPTFASEFVMGAGRMEGHVVLDFLR